YQLLIDPDKEKDKGISLRLKRLNILEVRTAYPFLLNIYHDYDLKKITNFDFLQILDMIESFIIRRYFCRVPTNDLNKIFIYLYNSLDNKDIINSLEKELLDEKWLGNQRFLEGIEKFPLYSSSTKKCRLILETLERYLTKNDEPVDLNYSKISIEHIMPQN